jgi:hypothetical protein
VTLLVRSDEHGVLVYYARRAPLRGWVGLPFGKLRLGDTQEATLARVMAKRGLASQAVTDQRFLGVANARYFERGQLVAHRVSSVWSVRYVGAAEKRETQHGTGLWLKELPSEGVLAEVRAIEGWPADCPALEIQADLA